jgi:hypothetical protein
MTDRAALVSPGRTGVDVRRLMYQTLICLIVARDCGRHQPGRFASPVDAQLFQRPPDALVHGVRADAEPDGDFLAAVMLVDEQETIDLALAEARNARRGIAPVDHIISLA